MVGWEVGLGRGALWRAPLAAAAVWALYLLPDAMLRGPVGEVMSRVESTQAAVTLGLWGAFLGLALAFSLAQAWRRQIEKGEP